MLPLHSYKREREREGFENCFADIVLSRADLRSLYDEQVPNLTYLALGYAHNLGITRMPAALLRMIGMDEAPEDVRQSKDHAMLRQNMHSTEEQRAYLGCYCLLSV